MAAPSTPEGMGRLPPGLYAVAVKAFASPALSSDALLALADMADQAAHYLPTHHAIRASFLSLAEMLRAAAPQHADTPLPSPSSDALPADAMTEAARILDAYGTAPAVGIAKLLRDMAAARRGAV